MELTENSAKKCREHLNTTLLVDKALIFHSWLFLTSLD